MTTSTPVQPPAIDLARVVRFAHPAKAVAVRLLPNAAALDDDVYARLLGVAPGELAAVRARLRAEVEDGARALLDDAEVAAAVAALPFAAGEAVVAVGDSLTDDLLSWAELLAEVLRHGDRVGRPDLAAVRVVNAGVSGDTTTHVVERFRSIAAHEPARVITLLQTNDARRDGPDGGEPMVAPQESARNLRTLRARLAAQTPARTADRRIWLTPPPVDAATVAAGYLAGLQLQWREDEVAARAGVLRSAVGDDTVVDVHTAFLDAGNGPDLRMPDGLHLSAAGQRLLLRTLLLALGGREGAR